MLVAAAISGSVTSDTATLFKVGRRLEAQGKLVRKAVAAIAGRAQQARSAEKHRVHSAPDPETVTQLPDLLAALNEREEAELELQLTEIYVGFHELEYDVLDADACVPAGRTRSAQSHVQPPAASASTLRHHFWEDDQLTQQEEAYDREHDELANMSMVKLLHSQLDVVRSQLDEAEKLNGELREELRTNRAENDRQYEEQWERFYVLEDEVCIEVQSLTEQLESLKKQLLVSRAGEAALHRVIHDNVMAMRRP
jgi:hypothetical protein